MSNYVMECKDLSKSYGSIKALDNITVNIERGKITGILGPNGSGKTTLIKIVNGLLKPDKGSVTINREPVGIKSNKAVSYLSDCVCMPEWMNVGELTEYYADFFDNFNCRKAEEMLKNLSLDKSQKIKTLSKGTKEKVQLVLTMSRDADIYILDEPMGGVDPATRDYIINTIISNYSENSAVLISTHLISDIENILDDVIFINKGKIILAETAENIRENRHMSVDALFREVFKC